MLTIGPACPETGFLKFETFAMHRAASSCPSDSEGSGPGEFDSEEESTCGLTALVSTWV